MDKENKEIKKKESKVYKRKCNTCGEEYKLSEFDLANSKLLYYRKVCKKCRRASNRIYYIQNKKATPFTKVEKTNEIKLS